LPHSEESKQFREFYDLCKKFNPLRLERAAI